MNTKESQINEEQILRERAEKYAVASTSAAEKAVIDTIAVLGVGRQKFGISSVKLEVIEKTPSIAHLPELPQVVRGLVQIRGELIAAVDMAGWFQITGGDGSYIAVVSNGDGKKLGMIIDTVLGFRNLVEGDMAESFFESKDKGGRPIIGATRDLVTILDVDMLFASAEIRRDNENTKIGMRRT